MRRLPFAAAVSTAALCLSAGWVPHAFADEPKAVVKGVDDKALRQLLQKAVGETKAAPRSRFEARRRAREAGEQAIELLRSEGYYGYEVTPDIGEGDAPEAFVTVDPGPRFRITEPKVAWAGDPPVPDAQAAGMEAMALKPGDPGRAAEVVTAESRIVVAVEKHGYADAAADPREVIVDHADMSVRPTFNIRAGELVRLDGIDFKKGSRTKKKWLLKLAPWKAGDIYSPDAVGELERRLLDTGVYDSVTVSLAPKGQEVEGRRPVIVSLSDRPKGTLELGASYSTAEGVGVDSSWTVYNRLGRADTIKTSLRVADIDSRLQTVLTLPHWRKPQQTLTLTATPIYREVTDAYDDTGASLRGELTKRYGKTSFLTYGVLLDAARITEKELEDRVTADVDRNLVTAAVYTAFSLDRSNDPLNPTRGWRAQAQVQPTASVGDGSVYYLRLQGQASAYLPFGEEAKTVLAGRVKVGSIVGGSIPLVPGPQRFFAGGGGSIRGYDYQHVGPLYPDGTPEGGLSVFETSFEVRQRVTKRWSVVAFLDAGSVGVSTAPTFRQNSVGAGLGARYDMGFGPIRVDVATPLNPRHGDSPVQVYLSIGQSF